MKLGQRVFRSTLAVVLATGFYRCTGPSGASCTPDASRSCTCASGRAGTQVCQPDHTYSACGGCGLDDVTSVDSAIDARDVGSDTTLSDGAADIVTTDAIDSATTDRIDVAPSDGSSPDSSMDATSADSGTLDATSPDVAIGDSSIADSSLVDAPTTDTASGDAATAPSWHLETVDTSIGGVEYTSLALDSAGAPHVAYADYTTALGNVEELRYAHKVGSTWILESADATGGRQGQYCSLALDASDHPHVSYYDGLSQHLKYAERSATSWTLQTVDATVSVGQHTSLAIDTSGVVHISYSLGASLGHAFGGLSGWTLEVPYVGIGDSVGCTSLALNPSNDPLISFFLDVGPSHGVLEFWTHSGAGWTGAAVTLASGVFGSFNALALDHMGVRHVAYYTATVTGGRLDHAVWNGTSWVLETVDSTDVDVGAYVSLAIDGNGNPHMSYFDRTTRDLRYARWDGSSWRIQTVDSTGDVGYYSSLALDSAGNPRISYVSSTSSALRYAAFY